MSEDYAEKKSRRKSSVDSTKSEEATAPAIIEVDSTKQKFRELFEQRPIFVGLEYRKLHLWYAELEKLLS